MINREQSCALSKSIFYIDAHKIASAIYISLSKLKNLLL